LANDVVIESSSGVALSACWKACFVLFKQESHRQNNTQQKRDQEIKRSRRDQEEIKKRSNLFSKEKGATGKGTTLVIELEGEIGGLGCEHDIGGLDAWFDRLNIRKSDLEKVWIRGKTMLCSVCKFDVEHLFDSIKQHADVNL